MAPIRRGKWGTFLLEQRSARKWTQADAFEELRAGLGLGPTSRASYVLLERGQRQPNPAQQRFLVGFYRAEPLEVSEVDDEPTLARALIALTDELRESRRHREDAEARLRAMEAGLALLAQRAGVEPRELLAPRA